MLSVTAWGAPPSNPLRNPHSEALRPATPAILPELPAAQPLDPAITRPIITSVVQATRVEEVAGPSLTAPANRSVARTPTRQVKSRTVLVPDSRSRVNLQDEATPPAAAEPAPQTLQKSLENEDTLSHEPTTENYGEEWLAESEPVYEEGYYGEEVYGGGACCLPCCLFPWCGLSFNDFDISVGTQAFTGPVNRGESSSFGFYESANWGTPLHAFCGALSGQVGVLTTQSNLSGATSTDEDRQQLFLTGGFFRRVDWGLQGGLVLDYLSEDWYTHYDLTQLRGELSWMFPCAHELGFWFTAGTNSDRENSVLGKTVITTTSEQWQATDLYAFYYRRRFDQCGAAEGRFSAGFTGNGDGLIGSDLRLPLSDHLALNTAFTYLIPTEAEGAGTAAGHAQEGWNLSLGFTWFPGCSSAYNGSYSRPLFQVANNGNFMVDRGN